MAPEIKLIAETEYRRLVGSTVDWVDKLALIADMCRANTLAMIKRAGSGHIGSSFSSLDIVTFLYYSEMNTANVGLDSPDRDIYFSSKGHDVPGLYSILFSLGILPRKQFLDLRRLGGTGGHPDRQTPGIEANSGSLGMGISKAKGMAFAKRLLGQGGRVFVMTGDGELQEGQIYEALQSAVHQGVTNLTVIVDHNKVQSDKPVKEIMDLGDLETKVRSFGWHVARCNGHDFIQLKAVFSEFRSLTERPKLLIADTIKGKGVSLMEHPQALQSGCGLYRWHSGAPDDVSFTQAYDEIIERVSLNLNRWSLSPLEIESITPEDDSCTVVSPEYVSEAYEDALMELARQRRDLIVLDADLATDCRIRAFEREYPDRFIENGIAEQDMVSMAGGLALQGLLPVVNTFAAFLASRANEQIYNNSCEGSRVVYVCHYAGLIPAGPGASHQSIRDISLLGAIPNLVILQPCNGPETRMAVEYCVNEAKENCALRLIMGPSPRLIQLPRAYVLNYGKGCNLAEGDDSIIFTYSPVMIHEALLASELLSEQNIGLQVVNMPWLNRVDAGWLGRTVRPHKVICVLEDHSPVGGLGDLLLNELARQNLLEGRVFHKFAVAGLPACGTNAQALRFHRLDGQSLAEDIRKLVEEERPCTI